LLPVWVYFPTRGSSRPQECTEWMVFSGDHRSVLNELRSVATTGVYWMNGVQWRPQECTEWMVFSGDHRSVLNGWCSVATTGVYWMDGVLLRMVFFQSVKTDVNIHGHGLYLPVWIQCCRFSLKCYFMSKSVRFWRHIPYLMRTTHEVPNCAVLADLLLLSPSQL
jgi:hypothetical protein